MSRLVPPYTEGKKLQALLAAIVRLWEEGTFKEYDKLFEENSAALTDAMKSREALSKDMDFQPYEPPTSTKYNHFFGGLWRDFSVLANEMDVLRAWAHLCYNHTTDGIDALSLSASQIKEQYKIALVLCSSSDNQTDEVMTNCTFVNRLPWEQFGGGTTVLTEEGTLQLANASDFEIKAPTDYAIVEGNGFAGDLHRAGLVKEEESEIPTEETVTFYYQIAGKHDTLNALKDNNPMTWFEYEMVDIIPKEYKKIKKYNIYYTTAEGNLRWCNHIEQLYMELLGGFKEPQYINRITMYPYFKNSSTSSTSQKQVPRLDYLRISQDGTEWRTLTPENFYLTDSYNLADPDTYDTCTIWEFEPTLVQYIHLRMTADEPQQAIGIGHYFYLDTTTDKRIDGPNPPLENPTIYDNSMDDAINRVSRRLEVLEGKRWTFGIRDISYFLTTYLSDGSAESKSRVFDKNISYVTLTTEDFVPEGGLIRYYISADNGKTWAEIRPTNREATSEYSANAVVSFNNKYPVELRQENVTYIETLGEANQFKVKVSFTAGSAHNFATTPQITNYIAKIVFQE